MTDNSINIANKDEPLDDGEIIQNEAVHQSEASLDDDVPSVVLGPKLKQNAFMCGTCGKYFTEKGNLKRHQLLHTGQKNHVCETCNKSFADRSDLKRHKKIHSGEKPYCCPVCKKSFTLMSGLRTHQVIHSDERPHVCGICQQAFKAISNLRQHEKNHFKECLPQSAARPYICDTCGRTYKLKASLTQHQLVHSGVRHECPQCGSKFTQKGHLREHMRNHTGERPFICEVCGQRFKIQGHLIIHRRKHTGEKPYSCPTCGKAFSSNSALNLHKPIHTGVKPYVCKICDYASGRTSDLSKHMKEVHHGIKPYSCSFCGQSFSRRSHIVRHERIHTGEKPYKCGICQKAFPGRRNLQKHEAVHTGARPFECGTCKKRFQCRGHLTRHEKTHIAKDTTQSTFHSNRTTKRPHKTLQSMGIAQGNVLAQGSGAEQLPSSSSKETEEFTEPSASASQESVTHENRFTHQEDYEQQYQSPDLSEDNELSNSDSDIEDTPGEDFNDMHFTMGVDMGIAEGLFTQWKDKRFLDYTIIVEGQEFNAHKCVLAAVSDYFKAMFSGAMVESNSESVVLHELTAKPVSKLIELIYTGNKDIVEKDPVELLKCSLYLQVPAAIELSKECLLKQVTVHNVIDTLSVLVTNGCLDVIENLTPTFKLGVTFESRHLSNLASEVMNVIVAMWQKSESELFQLITDWLEVDLHDRTRHANKLLSGVRFSLMSPKNLTAVQSSNIFYQVDGPWRGLLQNAFSYHSLPLNLKIIEKSEQCVPRGDPCITVLPEKSPDLTTWFTITENNWIKHSNTTNMDSHKVPDLSNHQPCTVVINNVLIVCTKYCVGQQFYAFDPHTQTWSILCSLPKPKDAFSLVGYNDMLYVLGGTVAESGEPIADIECYSFEAACWTKFGHLPLPNKNFATCVYGESLYISGGVNIGLERVSDHYKMDLNTGTWEWKASVPIEQSSHQMCAMRIKAEDYIVVIINPQYKLYAYNLITDQWSSIPLRGSFTPIGPYKYACTLITDKCIYIINGVQAMPRVKLISQYIKIEGDESENGSLYAQVTDFSCVPQSWIKHNVNLIAGNLTFVPSNVAL